MRIFCGAYLRCCILFLLFFITVLLGATATRRPLLVRTERVASRRGSGSTAVWHSGGKVACRPGDEVIAVQLMDAVIANDPRQLACLLSQHQGLGRDDIYYIESVTRDGYRQQWPLLWMASCCGHANVIKVLLAWQMRNKPCVSTMHDEDGLLVQIGESPLGVACRLGHVEAVRALLDSDISLYSCSLQEVQPPRSMWYCCCLCKPAPVFALSYELISSMIPAGAPNERAIKELLQEARDTGHHCIDLERTYALYDEAAEKLCQGRDILHKKDRQILIKSVFDAVPATPIVARDETDKNNKAYWLGRADHYVPFGR